MNFIDEETIYNCRFSAVFCDTALGSICYVLTFRGHNIPYKEYCAMKIN